MAASTSGNFRFSHFAEFHFVSWITVSNVHFSLEYADDKTEAYLSLRRDVITEVQRNTLTTQSFCLNQFYAFQQTLWVFMKR